MFVVTMTRRMLKRAVIAVCALLLIGTTIVGGVLLFGNDVDEVLATQGDSSDIVTNIEDVAKQLEGFGILTDVTTGEVSTVMVPKNFDEQFEEFNEIIKMSGGDLSKLKDRSVERWKVLTVNRSAGEEMVWAIMLVRNNKSVGCYLISEPSGQVFSIDDTENVSAPTETVVIASQSSSESGQTTGEETLEPQEATADGQQES